MVSGELLFEALEHGAHDVLAGLQNFMDVGVDFGPNTVVLLDVTVKRDIHSIGSRCLPGKRERRRQEDIIVSISNCRAPAPKTGCEERS
jgi:hypothetical protein